MGEKQELPFYGLAIAEMDRPKLPPALPRNRPFAIRKGDIEAGRFRWSMPGGHAKYVERSGIAEHGSSTLSVRFVSTFDGQYPNCAV